MSSMLSTFTIPNDNGYYRLKASERWISEVRTSSSTELYSSSKACSEDSDKYNFKGMVLISWHLWQNLDDGFGQETPPITIDDINIYIGPSQSTGSLYAGNYFISDSILLPFRSSYSVQLYFPKAAKRGMCQYAITTWKWYKN